MPSGDPEYLSLCRGGTLLPETPRHSALAEPGGRRGAERGCTSRLLGSEAAPRLPCSQPSSPVRERGCCWGWRRFPFSQSLGTCSRKCSPWGLENCSFVSILFLRGGQRLLEISWRSCLLNALEENMVNPRTPHSPPPPEPWGSWCWLREAWVLAGKVPSLPPAAGPAPGRAALLGSAPTPSPALWKHMSVFPWSPLGT